MGAIVGYFTYQQKKLCFKNRQGNYPTDRLTKPTCCRKARRLLDHSTFFDRSFLNMKLQLNIFCFTAAVWCESAVIRQTWLHVLFFLHPTSIIGTAVIMTIRGEKHYHSQKIPPPLHFDSLNACVKSKWPHEDFVCCFFVRLCASVWLWSIFVTLEADPEAARKADTTEAQSDPQGRTQKGTHERIRHKHRSNPSVIL